MMGRVVRVQHPALTAAMLLLLVSLRVSAQEQARGVVTYVTSSSAYVNLGAVHGFAVGDTLTATGARGPVNLVVTHLSSKSLAASITDRPGAVLAGDSVRGVPRYAAPAVPRLAAVPDSSATGARDAAGIEKPTVRPPSDVQALSASPPRSAVYRGRVSLQHHVMATDGRPGLDVHQPALVLNFSGDGLLDLPLSFTAYSNHRLDARPAGRRSDAVSPLSNRVYQVAVQYGGMTDPFSVALGRFLIPTVGGIGTMDGGMLVLREAGWEAGLAAGTQPDYRTSGLSTADPKLAAYVGYATGDYRATRYQGSAAFAQTWRARALDRAFVYTQHVLSFGNSISFYQNATVDWYDLVSGRGASSPHLSDLFLSGNWRPLRWLSVNGSYSTRRAIWFLRSFGNIADSLFNRSYLHGGQLGLGVSLPSAMYVSLSGSIRAQRGDSRPTTGAQLRYTWSDVLGTRTGVSLLAGIADSPFSRSTSTGVDIVRDLTRGVYGSLRLNRYVYTYASGARSIERTALGIDITGRLSSLVHGTVSAERTWEGALSGIRMYSELSLRW